MANDTVEPIPDEELRKSVGEQFNLLQSAVAIGAVFLGFVFAVNQDPTDRYWITLWLVGAECCLLLALAFFSITANEVIKYWKLFYPTTGSLNWGNLLLFAGAAFMMTATGHLLILRGLWLHFIILATSASIAVPSLFIVFHHMHKGGPYTRAFK